MSGTPPLGTRNRTTQNGESSVLVKAYAFARHCDRRAWISMINAVVFLILAVVAGCMIVSLDVSKLENGLSIVASAGSVYLSLTRWSLFRYACDCIHGFIGDLERAMEEEQHILSSSPSDTTLAKARRRVKIAKEKLMVELQEQERSVEKPALPLFQFSKNYAKDGSGPGATE